MFSAWNEFRLGKENKLDVQEFGLDLEDSIFELHDDLKNNNYVHSPYQSFYLHDPKLRHIFKAKVRDRILHHAIVKVISPIFEKSFIFDSYSSRKNKGTHKAIERFRYFARRLSRNNSRTIWILKCDIKKFFDSVDHDIIIDQVKSKVKSAEAVELVRNIVSSIKTSKKGGIPLGNLTSQLFSNIYLDNLDQLIKRQLRIKYYLRYNDDFMFLSPDKHFLENLIPVVGAFLKEKLNLELHPQKVTIKNWGQGVDFLGYIIFPHHTILRTKTKQRMLRKIRKNHRQLKTDPLYQKSFNQSFQSYRGILKHCRGQSICRAVNQIVALGKY